MPSSSHTLPQRANRTASFQPLQCCQVGVPYGCPGRRCQVKRKKWMGGSSRAFWPEPLRVTAIWSHLLSLCGQDPGCSNLPSTRSMASMTWSSEHSTPCRTPCMDVELQPPREHGAYEDKQVDWWEKGRCAHWVATHPLPPPFRQHSVVEFDSLGLGVKQAEVHILTVRNGKTFGHVFDLLTAVSALVNGSCDNTCSRCLVRLARDSLCLKAWRPAWPTESAPHSGGICNKPRLPPLPPLAQIIEPFCCFHVSCGMKTLG